MCVHKRIIQNFQISLMIKESSNVFRCIHGINIITNLALSVANLVFLRKAFIYVQSNTFFLTLFAHVSYLTLIKKVIPISYIVPYREQGIFCFKGINKQWIGPEPVT